MQVLISAKTPCSQLLILLVMFGHLGAATKGSMLWNNDSGKPLQLIDAQDLQMKAYLSIVHKCVVVVGGGGRCITQQPSNSTTQTDIAAPGHAEQEEVSEAERVGDEIWERAPSIGSVGDTKIIFAGICIPCMAVFLHEAHAKDTLDLEWQPYASSTMLAKAHSGSTLSPARQMHGSALASSGDVCVMQNAELCVYAFICTRLLQSRNRSLVRVTGTVGTYPYLQASSGSLLGRY